MTWMRFILLAILWMSALGQLAAQINPQTRWADVPRKGFIFPLSYSVQLPAADMADRFGWSQSAGLGILHKSFNGFLLGLDGDFIFGKTVKADSLYLDGLFNSLGFVTGNSGNPAEIVFFERGFTIMAKIGKIFPTSFSNKNSGWMVQGGLGFMQHQISIVDRQTDVAQLFDEYKKGYDRLSSGIVLRQYFGYLHLDRKRFKNFSIGLEATQGFNKGRRTWNFDERAPGTKSRLDLLFALKIAWILPVYSSADQQEYYFD